ncbi:unnamed protein product [Polarella glacialis]|uniref:ANK_REP_REGION domain-containing protein n=1 Tax=Polarella glacialis TaxID=89957 RepID=A0A813FNY1_POLGL|nr:unnamed protein product [Polarella glacialis]
MLLRIACSLFSGSDANVGMQALVELAGDELAREVLLETCQMAEREDEPLAACNALIVLAELGPKVFRPQLVPRLLDLLQALPDRAADLAEVHAWGGEARSALLLGAVQHPGGKLLCEVLLQMVNRCDAKRRLRAVKVSGLPRLCISLATARVEILLRELPNHACDANAFVCHAECFKAARFHRREEVVQDCMTQAVLIDTPPALSPDLCKAFPIPLAAEYVAAADGCRLSLSRDTTPACSKSPSISSLCSDGSRILLGHASVDSGSDDGEMSSLTAPAFLLSSQLLPKFLAQRGLCDLASKDRRGRNALLQAVACGERVLCAEIILRANHAELNAYDAAGETALHVAAQCRCPDIGMALLLCSDFDQVNRQNCDGSTALHFAAGYGCVQLCTNILSLKQFQEANAQNFRGCTALHFAAANNHAEVCSVLLSHSTFTFADAEDVNSLTALDVARPAAFQAILAGRGRRRLCRQVSD